MRWGLVPFFWKKSLKEVPATFNARAETVAENRTFRESFKRRPCIIPASGFFEWTGEKGESSRIFSRPPTARRSSPSKGCGIAVSIRCDKGGNPLLHDHRVVHEALRPAAESTLREWTASKRAAAPPAGAPSEARRDGNGAAGRAINGAGHGTPTAARRAEKSRAWKQTPEFATPWA